MLTNKFKLRPAVVGYELYPSLPFLPPSLSSLSFFTTSRHPLCISKHDWYVTYLLFFSLCLYYLVGNCHRSQAQRIAVSTHYPFTPFSDYSFRYNSCCLKFLPLLPNLAHVLGACIFSGLLVTTDTLHISPSFLLGHIQSLFHPT